MTSYADALAEIATTSQDELRTDLESLRAQSERLHAEAASADRRVAMLEGLLDLAKSSTEGPHVFTSVEAPRTLHEAMAEVLRTAPERMMRAGDLAAAIERRGLYRMRDGRPVEAQQIHARVGHYGNLFTKEGTFIKLQ